MNNDDLKVQLVYASVKDSHLDGGALKELVDRARDFNTANNLTGMMVGSSQYFLQALEGSRNKVNQLYSHIIDDSRHHHPQIIHYKEITETTWPNWSMEFISITKKEELLYQKYTGLSAFNPYKIKADEILNFMKKISV